MVDVIDCKCKAKKYKIKALCFNDWVSAMKCETCGHAVIDQLTYDAALDRFLHQKKRR